MAGWVEIDLDLLKRRDSEDVRSVSARGRRLPLRPAALVPKTSAIRKSSQRPESAVGSFAGVVANPWKLGRLAPGERVARPRLGPEPTRSSPRRCDRRARHVTGTT